VLSTPPAFVLSQDQTLQTKPKKVSSEQSDQATSQNWPKKQHHTPKREKEVRQKTTTNKNHQTHY
jgi:hypothetical protein